ncbi:NTP/NDP exchange transporter [Roseibacillus persicicus]|uniref:NTP/NDP exchange transporter n=1 Tax=Roseibacillus persicicus TaxID=454148 RepID=UPI00280C752C|nr:MFS transporter [Roseibacillus persicicus]MDQ8189842.1 MFS transporter [Roseibacillus persicicus]
MTDKPLFTRLTQVEPSEAKGALISFVFVFMLMASYTIMKPVRDALPSDWGDVSLAMQWTYTFIFSTIAVVIYNLCASLVSLRRLVPGVFAFFATSFIAIYLAYKTGQVEVTLLGKIFYVWTSVFNLFQISVFWSFISQHYNKSESKRVFGFINTGASAGAIAGPLLILQLAEHINAANILLITGIVLLLTLPLIHLLNRIFDQKEQNKQTPPKLSPNPFSGFMEFITHRRLLGIAAFIFLFTGISAFLYVAQTDLLRDYSRAERKELLGSVELATNTLTILLGIFATNRLARRFGMATTLSLIPFLVALLLLLLSANPAVVFVLALQVVRRAGNYAITRPAREILFTAVDREARFKTKPIIDVMVYRGGDVVWIWVLAFLGDAWLKLGVTPTLCIGAAVAVLWGIVGIFLGKTHDAADAEEGPSKQPS